ncbi:MAG: L-2-hydroxyglutarate oxidase [Armatimonadota bacterium]|nr:L-2-hydroxyglutarate oxidase [Armatimonadota bacterium]
MKNPNYDIAIIGGGIIGLATAMTLAERYRRYRTVALEKEAEVATHQTGHNSGVIHSGIYYRPGSLKARLCVEGARRLVEFAQEHNVPYERCGKVIVATAEDELPRLQTLWERGVANGVPGLEIIDAGRVKELEPHASALRGIYSPHTGIIDFAAVARAMAQQFISHSGQILTGAKVTGIKQTSDELCLLTGRGEVLARHVINCGGLHADTIARMMGVEPAVRIVPFRGEYYMVRPERRDLVRNLIYPVPDPNFPFLGVHFTRTIHGDLEAGPNAVLAFAREGYRRTDFRPQDTLSMIAHRGFWAMARQHWKMGAAEFYRSLSKPAFTRSLQKLVPEIRQDDLLPGPSGVRAQCVDRHGFLLDDFKIVEAPHAIHVLNVPSPAATASLAIAPYIVALAAKCFEL